ncbi:MAG: hypothetical protein BWY75_01981 [bacterium ADurb.Bin425]|nr:MAG: hypothetical protein BWY75_01981 [bacterium ADurb.Bin425]
MRALKIIVGAHKSRLGTHLEESTTYTGVSKQREADTAGKFGTSYTGGDDGSINHGIGGSAL